MPETTTTRPEGGGAEAALDGAADAGPVAAPGVAVAGAVVVAGEAGAEGEAEGALGVVPVGATGQPVRRAKDSVLATAAATCGRV
ncbi:MAG: hypothetical protein VKS61_13270 [Candidatus Sericytochromatia bacterium]|nr:hypothetical protein [Candidatus Sericytochromatia bacterium]